MAYFLVNTMRVRSKFKTMKIVIGMLSSINVGHSASNSPPSATLSANNSGYATAPKAGLKVYRNENGEIIEHPPTDTPSAVTDRAIERQIDTTPVSSPVIMRNPNPDGGWMMILDGQFRAKQMLDRRGNVHCQIDKKGSVNHRFPVKKIAANSDPK
jgi:hypothetical protein